MKRIKLTIEMEVVYTGPPYSDLTKIIKDPSMIASAASIRLHNQCAEDAYTAIAKQATFKLEEVKQ